MTTPDEAEPASPQVSAVIVNYNAGAHLVEAVRSARSEGLDEVVVVDNGSSDDSIETLLKEFPEVEIHRLPNPGFGAANNHGVAKSAGQYVWCMNPDTTMHPGAIKALVELLDADPTVAAVGPLMLNVDGSTYPSARSFPVLSNAAGHAAFSIFWPTNPWSRAYKRLDLARTELTEADWVSGAAMLIRREAFESVNGFDDAYFMYMEDVDLCWRMRRAGWKVMYQPAAVVTHVGAVSTQRRPYHMLKEHHRSAIRYNFRTAQGWQRVLLPVMTAGLLARLPVAWLHRWRLQRHE